MKLGDPRVSVVMPAYNRAKFIGSAIESVLMQTYKDFELIIVDDGSTDNTVEIIKTYDDSRIKLFKHEKNYGVAVARNTGYRNSKGEFIAIADSDDLNHPERLLKKVTFLDENPDIDVVTCCYQEIDFNDNYRSKVMFDSENDQIRANWIFDSGIPSFMMFRKEKIKSRNLLYHDITYKAAVDYQWYASLDDDLKLYCLPEVLYYYRRHQTQISTKGFSLQQNYGNRIRLVQLEKMGIKPTDEEFNIHQAFSVISEKELDNQVFHQFIEWSRKIKQANEKSCFFHRKYLNKVLAKKLNGHLNNEPIYDPGKGQILAETEFHEYLDDIQGGITSLEIKKILDKIRGKKIFIFGTKKMGYKIKKLLEEEKIYVFNFVDNNQAVHHKQLERCEIIPPRQITNIKEKVFIISIVSSARFEVREQLINKYGASEENVYILDDLNDKQFKK